MTTALSLRPLALSDWPRVHEWAARPEASRYQPWGPNTPDQTQAFVEEAVRTSATDKTSLRVWAAEVDGVVVGIGQLKVREDAEIGYTVHTGCWGRGYGTAIALALVAVARAEGHRRIIATCDPRNTASGKVLLNAGFRWTQRRERTVELRDGWRDSDVYVLD